MNIRKILCVIASCIALFASCSDIASEQQLTIGNVEAHTVFSVGDYGQLAVFNTSAITVENGCITDGNLASTYTENGINGFGTAEGEVKGYFLPLRILSSSIDEDASVEASFMDHAVQAEILRSGESCYVVVNLTDDGTLKFDGAELSIKIVSGRITHIAALEINQRPSTTDGSAKGLLLNPVIVAI